MPTRWHHVIDRLCFVSTVTALQLSELSVGAGGGRPAGGRAENHHHQKPGWETTHTESWLLRHTHTNVCLSVSALESRCLQLVVHYIPVIRAHFETRLQPKQYNILRHFDHITKVTARSDTHLPTPHPCVCATDRFYSIRRFTPYKCQDDNMWFFHSLHRTIMITSQRSRLNWWLSWTTCLQKLFLRWVR